MSKKYESAYDILKSLFLVYQRVNSEIIRNRTAYVNACQDSFSDLYEFKDDTIGVDLVEYFKNGLIETIETGMSQQINKESIFRYIVNGSIAITQYGLSYVFMNDKFNDVLEIIQQQENSIHLSSEILSKQAKLIEDNSNRLEGQINSSRDELNKFKESFYFQILVIISVFVAIIAFVFQSISLLNNKEFLSLCFLQQLATVSTIYIPFVAILLVFALILFIRKK